MRFVFVLAAVLAGVVPAAAAPEAAVSNQAHVMTTVNRMEIVIARSAEAIWPYLLDLTKWAPEAQKVEYLNGHRGELGSRVRRRTFQDGRLVQDRIEEIVVMEPARRLAVHIQLAPPDPTKTDVIANLELTPAGNGRTTLRLDVYLSSVPAEALDFDSLQRRKREIETATTPELLARYQQLKAAVEKQ